MAGPIFNVRCDSFVVLLSRRCLSHWLYDYEAMRHRTKGRCISSLTAYNLLHVNRSLIHLNSVQLQWERTASLINFQLTQKLKPCRITVVFDGWQGGWNTEKEERKKGIELIYSKLGEKADEVIKRLAQRERFWSDCHQLPIGRLTKICWKMAVAVIHLNNFVKS